MNPRQARRERREAERKANKARLKQGLQSTAVRPEDLAPGSPIQPRWNPELEDEFPREVQIRNNALFDRRLLNAGQPLPPAGPEPSFAERFHQLRAISSQRAASKRTASNPASTMPPFTMPAAAEPAASPAPEIGFVSQTEPSPASPRPKRATGPRTSHGKSTSSRNSLKHGLASGELIMPGESREAFETLLADLLLEHAPSSATEELLVNTMAQGYWLGQRALRLQTECFSATAIDEKRLALFLRYGTTHDRAFHKALATLLKIKGDQARAQQQFVSQTLRKAKPPRQFVSQNVPPPHPEHEFVSQNHEAESLEPQPIASEAA